MNVGWPEGIYLVLSFVGLGMIAAKHGEPKDGNHNVFVSLTASAIIYGLLWWGGFFA